MKCDLDAEHDWLPRRIEAPNGAMVWVASKFKRESGLSFPVEGFMEQVDADRKMPQRTFFRVTAIKLNKNVSPSAFGLPPLGEGVLVRDEISGRTTINGGPEARKRLEERHMITDAKEKGDPIRAPQQSTSHFWTVVLVLSSCTAFVSAWSLRHRQTRSNGD